MQLRNKHHSYVVLAVLKVSVSAKWNKFQHEHTKTQTPGSDVLCVCHCELT